MKKTLTKILLSLFMAFSLIFISACAYSDTDPVPGITDGENTSGSIIGSISGVKTLYRPELIEIADFYKNFSNELMLNLASMFGNASIKQTTETQIINGTETQVIPFIYEKYQAYLSTVISGDAVETYKNFENSVLVYLVDDIRNSIYIHTPNSSLSQVKYYSYKNLNNKWAWHHDLDISNSHGYNAIDNKAYAFTYINGLTAPGITFTSENLLSQIKSSNEIFNERENYYKFYAEQFAPAMQVVVLQILLERQPTTFAFNMTTNKVEPDASQLLGDGKTSGLKYEYSKYTNFIGISEENKTAITEYILEKVIGNAKYSNNQNFLKKEDYKHLINETIWNGSMKDYSFSNEKENHINDKSLGSIYEVFPVAELKDYDSNSFFISSQDKTAFSHIPSAEYRSIMILPNANDYLMEVWFYVATENNLNIKYFYRHYDAEKNTYVESSIQNAVTEKESSFKHSKAQMNTLSFKNNQGKTSLLKTFNFNNNLANGLINASKPKPLDYKISSYFEKVNNSFGISLDKMKDNNQSFFEIVFVVDKSNDLIKDYNFKVGLLQFWFANQGMIDKLA